MNKPSATNFRKQQKSPRTTKVLTFTKRRVTNVPTPSRPNPELHHRSICYLLGWTHSFYDAIRDDGVSWPVCRFHFPDPVSPDDVPPSVLYDRGYRDGGLFRRSLVAPYPVLPPTVTSTPATPTPATNTNNQKVCRTPRSASPTPQLPVQPNPRRGLAMLPKSMYVFAIKPLPTELGSIGSLLSLLPLGVGDQMTILFVTGAGVLGLLDAFVIHWWITRTPFIRFRMPAPKREERDKSSQLPLAA
jgi:hypothetical protein